MRSIAPSMSDDAAGRRKRQAIWIIVLVPLVSFVVLGAFAVWWFLRALTADAPPPPPTSVVVGPSETFRRYEREIAETADRNFDGLSEEYGQRGAAAYARNHGDRTAFARWVDVGVRWRVASDAVTACFRDDKLAVAALSTDRLSANLAAGELPRRRGQLGPIASCVPHSSATVGNWRDVVTATAEFDALFERGGAAAVSTDLVYVGGGQWRVDDISVVPYPPGKRRTPKLASAYPIASEHCDGCGAIRFHAPNADWTLVGGRADHAHSWAYGASSGPSDPVRCGVVVLVARPPIVGAFVFRRVSVDTWGKCDYEWAWRDDGGTSLDPSDAAVRHGRTESAARIDLGGVRVGWSDHAEGSAWLRYAQEVGEPVADESPRLCVTDATSFAGLDLADPRWTYRASSSDPGGSWAALPK
jgi:hypothetical protein